MTLRSFVCTLICMLLQATFFQGADHPSRLEQFLKEKDADFEGIDEHIKSTQRDGRLITIQDFKMLDNMHNTDYTQLHDLWIETSKKRGTITKTVSALSTTEPSTAKKVPLMQIDCAYRPSPATNIHVIRAFLVIGVLVSGYAGYKAEGRGPQAVGLLAGAGGTGLVMHGLAENRNQQSVERFDKLTKDGKLSSDELYALMYESLCVNQQKEDEGHALEHAMGGAAISAVVFGAGCLAQWFTKK